LRAIRDLIAIMLILAMAAVSASACHESGQALQDHHGHHHAMATADASHHAEVPAISHAHGLPLRIFLHKAALPVPLDTKAGEKPHRLV
jgi:hypothetical protein